MDEIENLLHRAALGSAAPALPPDAAKRALRGVRRRRQWQAAGVGGMTVAVVGGGAVLASSRSDGSRGLPVGGVPVVTPTLSEPPAAVVTSPVTGSLSAVTSATATSAAAMSAAATSPGATTLPAGRTEAPASTPACQGVKTHLAQVGGPVGYVRTDTIEPAQFVWQRGWLRADKAHASLEVAAFCVEANALAPQPASSETVQPVTVQGHQGLLTTDFGGAFARVTWNPNATTEVSVSANAFQPNSWGRTTTTELKAARLTDEQLLAFAQTVPIG